ncbi:hypothetical protein LY474_32430 [Myxococcus stipitatus]|uniref:hypothetical protein n=1 Tax=Myxococcus stipitatus TaxID=83455 RepID=UPI001F354177|nr:hypothetical protein [Myxococcus stipitatus]MCE9672525.1 hypothetical protein [Myxococcus stipitatus]
MYRRLIVGAALSAVFVAPRSAPARESSPGAPETSAIANWIHYGYYDTLEECIAMGETRGDPPLIWWTQYNCSHESVGDPRWLLQVYATW